LIDITAKDDFLVSKALVSLMEKGVIEKKEISPVVIEEIPAALEIKKPVISYRFLPLIAIAISLLLSLFTIFLSSDDIFRGFTASGSINDLRFQIETYRFERGSYPETLDVISRSSDPWGRPYIYKQNGYTFIVMSAGADGKEGTTDDIY
jgi:Type II secretion system (T2SS), protein G